MEALSPPRVTPHSPAAGVEDAGAWDLTSGWDATEDAQYGDAAEARRDDDDAQSMTVPQHARRDDDDVQSMTVPQHARREDDDAQSMTVPQHARRRPAAEMDLSLIHI